MRNDIERLESAAVFALKNDRPRIAVLSTTIPPGASGQARVLGHLLGFPPPRNYLLLADQSPFPAGIVPSSVAANCKILMSQPAFLIGEGWLAEHMTRFNALAGMLCSVFYRAREIDRHVCAFGASALVTCTASPFDLPASTLVALQRRIRFIPYLFDDPIYQWPLGPLRTFARLWESVWSRIASEVITPNEALAREYCRRHGRSPIIVRNPVPPEAFSSQSQPWPTNPGHFRIVYTGSVYHAQADAFLSLMTALEELDDWTLHIYTSQSETEVMAYGIGGSKVFRHDYVDQIESYRVQQSADVLFLPLAFHSTIQETLRTSAPMKMGEYLASGRPVLAHAPSDTFVAQHLQESEAAIVVDRPDPTSLAKALREIKLNSELRHHICENAARLAQNYVVEGARRSFWNAIGLIDKG